MWLSLPFFLSPVLSPFSFPSPCFPKEAWQACSHTPLAFVHVVVVHVVVVVRHLLVLLVLSP